MHYQSLCAGQLILFLNFSLSNFYIKNKLQSSPPIYSLILHNSKLSLPRHWCPSPMHFLLSTIIYFWSFQLECQPALLILCAYTCFCRLGHVCRHARRLEDCSPLYLRQGLSTKRGWSMSSKALTHLLLQDRSLLKTKHNKPSCLPLSPTTYFVLICNTNDA